MSVFRNVDQSGAVFFYMVQDPTVADISNAVFERESLTLYPLGVPDGSAGTNDYHLLGYETYYTVVGSNIRLYGDEYLQAKDSPVFVASGADGYRIQERKFGWEIADAFRATQSGLSLVAAEALFSDLESTAHAAANGLINIAWFRFNAIPVGKVSAAAKAPFNLMFEAHFNTFPRDRS